MMTRRCSNLVVVSAAAAATVVSATTWDFGEPDKWGCPATYQQSPMQFAVTDPVCPDEEHMEMPAQDLYYYYPAKNASNFGIRWTDEGVVYANLLEQQIGSLALTEYWRPGMPEPSGNNGYYSLYQAAVRWPPEHNFRGCETDPQKCMELQLLHYRVKEDLVDSSKDTLEQSWVSFGFRRQQTAEQSVIAEIFGEYAANSQQAGSTSYTYDATKVGSKYIDLNPLFAQKHQGSVKETMENQKELCAASDAKRAAGLIPPAMETPLAGVAPDAEDIAKSVAVGSMPAAVVGSAPPPPPAPVVEAVPGSAPPAEVVPAVAGSAPPVAEPVGSAAPVEPVVEVGSATPVGSIPVAPDSPFTPVGSTTVPTAVGSAAFLQRHQKFLAKTNQRGLYPLMEDGDEEDELPEDFEPAVVESEEVQEAKEEAAKDARTNDLALGAMFARYDGSATVPPCSPVKWFVRSQDVFAVDPGVFDPLMKAIRARAGSGNSRRPRHAMLASAEVIPVNEKHVLEWVQSKDTMKLAPAQDVSAVLTEEL